MKFQANINDTVEVVLTATGAEIYNTIRSEYIAEGLSYLRKKETFYEHNCGACFRILESTFT